MRGQELPLAVCKKGDLYIYELKNNDFLGMGIKKGQRLYLNKNASPALGDFGLLHAGQECQLVLFCGKSLLGYDIVAYRFIEYPECKELTNRSGVLGKVSKIPLS